MIFATWEKQKLTENRDFTQISFGATQDFPAKARHGPESDVLSTSPHPNSLLPISPIHFHQPLGTYSKVTVMNT
jgi:hypothetical protein